MVEKVEKVEKKKVEPIQVTPQDDVRVSITSGNWPVHLLREWEIDCKANYNDIRWMKIYSDHKQAKQIGQVMGMFTELKSEIEELKEEVFLLKHGNKEENVDDEVVETCGGGKGTIKG